MELLELELRKLGLKEKEVRVYLAGLELGPSSAQEIAKAAKTSRPTVYEIIKTLKQKGLFDEFWQKEKRYFTAHSPETILGLLRIKKRELEEKEREFIRIIAALKARYSAKEKKGIQTFTGKEAIKFLEEEFAFTDCPRLYLLGDKNIDSSIKKRVAIYKKIKKRLGKIEVKEISSKKIKAKINYPWLERKTLPSLNLKGTLLLFNKAIFLPSNTGRSKALLIDDELTVSILRTLFLALWQAI